MTLIQPNQEQPKQKPNRYLYLKNVREDGIGIELKSAIKDEAEQTEKTEGILKDLFKAFVGDSDQEVVDIFNSRIIGLSASTKHESIPEDFPKEDEIGSKTNPIKPSKGDYITPGGKNDPFENHFNLDGKTFPLTILSSGEINEYGVPEVVHLQDGMEFGGKFQKIWYVDPKTNKPTKGIYFEITEPAGTKGDGGTNGVIVPASLLPLAVIKEEELKDQNKINEFNKDPLKAHKEGYFKTKWDNDTYKYFKPKEAWFIGVKESQEKLDPNVKLGLNLDISA